jgi:hypothetical protein
VLIIRDYKVVFDGVKYLLIYSSLTRRDGLPKLQSKVVIPYRRFGTLEKINVMFPLEQTTRVQRGVKV